jgi:hypothetical protein
VARRSSCSWPLTSSATVMPQNGTYENHNFWRKTPALQRQEERPFGALQAFFSPGRNLLSKGLKLAHRLIADTRCHNMSHYVSLLVMGRDPSPFHTDGRIGCTYEKGVTHSYFVIRKPQTVVLFVIRKPLSISYGTVSLSF